MPTYKQLKCEQCNASFKREIRQMHKGNKTFFCSRRCSAKFQNKTKEVVCKHCSKKFIKRRAEIKKTPNHFCSRSCAVTYNNLNKKHGTRRSKLEIWIEKQLAKLYPNLEIHFNKKDTINSELDIFIPSLKLAFELNGVFHYKPIFGEEKLRKIQANDKRKIQTCLEQNIVLHEIDVSKFKHFNEAEAHLYLNVICNIID